MINAPKLFIFDLDGVLVDSKEVHFKSLNEALKDIDPKYIITEQEQKDTYEGLSTNQKLKILSEQKGLPDYQYDRIWKLKQENSIKFFDNLDPDAELIDIFSTIKESNISIAIASNSIKRTVEACINSLGIGSFVDFYVTNEDGIEPKPSTDMYIRCMQHFNVSKHDTVILEDSYIGRVGSINSGAKVVHIKERSYLTIDVIKDCINKKRKKINFLIPMAGEGSRFAEQGYKDIKPLIKVNDKKMIELVYDNLNIDAHFIFVVQEKHYDVFEIEKEISGFCKDYTIIKQNGKVEGATISALLATDIINTDEPLMIANSDQFVIWNSKKTINNFLESGVDGAILTFTATDKKWSFVKRNFHGFVSAVAEKNAISDEATCGIYYWKHGSDFVKYSKQMIEKNIRTNNEFYICPVYNEAINDEKIISAYPVYEMWGLGTPEDLETFLEFHK
jgi:beta-phosphoglucomutase-like phosphatase (HAD superfamily)/dTDP-glucose pyrophosphorylase